MECSTTAAVKWICMVFAVGFVIRANTHCIAEISDILAFLPAYVAPEG